MTDTLSDVQIHIGDQANNYGVVVGVNNGTINNLIQVAQLVTSLHQLRAPLADFVGRTSEIEQLLAALRGRSAIAAIWGMDGIGKTELAIAIANRLRADYPDAQLFVSLRGPDPRSARSPAEGLRDAIRAFDPSAHLPDDLQALAALYRGHLGSRRALVVLDDVPDAAAAQSFLPPDGSALLTTSRNRLSLGGQGLTLELGPFARVESRALLLDDVPRLGGDPAIDGLLDQCGDLPLAVRVIAATLAGNPALTAERYLARLADESRRLKTLHSDEQDVYAALGVGDDLLAAEEPELAARWRMLGVCPAPFEAAVVASIWEEQDPDRLDDALAQLVRRSLLRYDTQTSRYRIHPLLRDVAHARRSAESDMPARLRHGLHYLAVAREAVCRYQSGSGEIAVGLALFDAARPHIEAARLWAAATTVSGADRLSIDYPLAIYKLLPLRLAPIEQITWLEAALAAAHRLESRTEEPRLLVALGHARNDSGDGERAASCYNQARSFAQALGDRHTEGLALAGLANITYQAGDSRRALLLYQQWLARARELGDRDGESRALINLGAITYELGDARAALKHYAQGLLILRQRGERSLEGIVLSNLGEIYQALGRPQRAIESYEQSLTIARELRNRYVEGIALGNLAGAYLALGETGRAGACLAESLTIAREVDDRDADLSAGWSLVERLAAEAERAGALDLLRALVAYEQQIGHTDAARHAEALSRLEQQTAEGGSP